MKKTKYQPDKLEADEFALRHLAIGNVELAYSIDTFKKIGLELKTKKVLLELRRWNKKATKFISVRDCVVISVKQLEEALPKTYKLCQDTFLKEENPEKYNRYKLIKKLLEKAKKGYERNLPKSRQIYDDIYEELHND